MLTRESGRHLEVFCEGAAFWTDDDYLGPLHVQTSDRTYEVMGELPEWADRLTVPEVYAKSIAHYGAAAKAFLDALGGAPEVGTTPGRVGRSATRARVRRWPRTGLVDEAYRSAASGGVPIEHEPAR